MKKIYGLMFIVIMLFYSPSFAADVKISELPAVTSATTATDVLPIVASSVTSKITLANLIKAGLTFGSDAQYDILVRGAATYGRLASSADIIAFLGAANDAAARTELGLGTMAVETATNYFPYSLADAAGDLFQGSADNTIAKLTKGAEGTLLRAGATLNAYTTATFADTYAKGTFLYNASANTVASLAHPGAANYLLATNAADTSAWFASSANMISLLGSADYATARTNLGLAIGTNVQAYDAELAAIAGLTFADVSIIQLTGAGAAAVLTCTANQIIGANAAGDALECKSTLNITAVNLPASDADPSTTPTGTGNAVAFGQIAATLSLTSEHGTFTLTGQTAALLRNYTLGAAYGAYALTGQTATLLRNSAVGAAYGTFTLTGQSAALLRNSTLGSAHGSFALTGQEASLLTRRTVSATYGTFTLTGQAAFLVRPAHATPHSRPVRVQLLTQELRVQVLP